MNTELNQTAVKYFTDRLFSFRNPSGAYIDKVIDVYNLEYERERLHLTYTELESEKLVRLITISDITIKVYLAKEGVDFIKMVLDFKKV